MNKTVLRKVLMSSSITLFILAPILAFFLTGPLSHFQCEIEQPDNGWCELGAGVIIAPIIFLVTAALAGTCLIIYFRIKR